MNKQLDEIYKRLEKAKEEKKKQEALLEQEAINEYNERMRFMREERKIYENFISISYSSSNSGGGNKNPNNPEFIFGITLSPNDKSFTIPLENGYSYDFSVDWGDGSPIEKVATYSDPTKTHSYSNYGNYQIKF